MSEHLRAAREHLRAAVGDIDARIAEIAVVLATVPALQAEVTDLHDARRELLAIIDGRGTASEVRDAVAAPPPAARPASPPPAALDTGVRDVDAWTRIEAALSKADEPLRYPQLARVSRLTPWGTRRLVNEMVAAGRLVKTGLTHATRYSLPSGRAKRTAASSPNGTPADDTAHGADPVVTSVGDADVTPPPVDATSLQQPGPRPPVPDDADDFDIAETFTEEAEDAFDAQDVLDEEPCIRRPGRPPAYKPGTRQLPAARETVSGELPWWARPDADFKKEAERMRTAPPSRSTNVPSALHIIGMNGVW
jgi:hypothetical protein